MRRFVSGMSAKKNPFWNSLPMTRFGEIVSEEGIIKNTTYDSRPTALPPGFEWATYDLNNPSHLHQIVTLLDNHYIQFEEKYKMSVTKEFLTYKLLKPGYISDLFLGIRDSNTKEIMGFHSGVPHKMNINGNEINVCEQGNLCVLPRLRLKYQFAKLLSIELIRRTRAHDIMIEIFSSYTCNSQQPFTELGIFETLNIPVMNRKRIPGIRKMNESDVPQVHSLYSIYNKKYKAYYIYSMDEFRHIALPKENVVQTLVVEKGGRITDYISYSIWKYYIDNVPGRFTELDYYAVTETPLKDLALEAMIDAHNDGIRYLTN